jgi:hypothetical protein
MTRGISSEANTALAAQKRRVVDLVRIVGQDQGTLFNIQTGGTNSLDFTNCDVDLSHDSVTYSANAGYIGHSAITETVNAANDKMSLAFTGVDLTNAYILLNSNFVGAKVTIRKAVINQDYSITTNGVYSIFEGFVNTFNLSHDKETADFTLECGGPFSAFEKASIYGYATTLSHQIVFEGDKGFEFTTETLTDLQWGKQ